MKTFSKAEVEGNFASQIKGSYKNPAVNISLNGDRMF